MTGARQRVFAWVWVFCLLWIRPCAAQTHEELRVAAAADLTRAFTEVGRAFETQTGQKVTLIFGSSGQLAQQIENGAPFDVFASANEEYVARLDSKHRLLSDTRRIYAIGKLVFWARKGGPPLPTNLAELADARYAHIAIANPQHAPYGMAAKQALEKAGVWDKIQSKLVMGENIQQTYQFAASGNADVAFVSRSLASDDKGVFRPVPITLYTPLRQAIAVVQSSSHAPLARRFIAFVTGRDGQAILAKYGFEQEKGERKKEKVSVLLPASSHLPLMLPNSRYFLLSPFAFCLP